VGARLLSTKYECKETIKILELHVKGMIKNVEMNMHFPIVVLAFVIDLDWA